MESFHFLRPLWLLALPVAAYLILVLQRASDARYAWRDVIDPQLLEVLLTRGGRQGGLRPVPLLGLLWLLCIVALAGPSWRREPSPFAGDEAALVLVVEAGPSMASEDVQPSRIERAAQKIADLTALRPDADIALFAYAGDAHRVMPLTRDANVIGYFARALSPEIMPTRGDAAAAAIAAANEELTRARRAGSIVLFSDGVAADELAKIRASSSVPVHVLALGAPPPDPASLAALADATGGSVVTVTADDRDVQRLAQVAERRIGRVADAGDGVDWKDEGYWLVPLLALLVLFWSRRGWVIPMPGRSA